MSKLFTIPPGTCPITGWTFYASVKNHEAYKKKQREKYRATKAKKQ